VTNEAAEGLCTARAKFVEGALFQVCQRACQHRGNTYVGRREKACPIDLRGPDSAAASSSTDMLCAPWKQDISTSLNHVTYA